jgi:hypothetical protein
MKYLLFILLAFSTASYADNTNRVVSTYAKVLKVDNNNIFHLGIDGDYVHGHLSFIRMPIKGDLYFDEVHNDLKRLEGQWLLATEVKRLSTTNSRSFLLYFSDGQNLNMDIVRRGLAFPFIADSPPGQLLDTAITAQNEKKGLWKDPNFRFNNENQNRMNRYLSRLKKLQQGMATKIRDLYFKVDNNAYHYSCIFDFNRYDHFIFDVRSAINRGLNIMPRCDGKPTIMPDDPAFNDDIVGEEVSEAK